LKKNQEENFRVTVPLGVANYLNFCNCFQQKRLKCIPHHYNLGSFNVLRVMTKWSFPTFIYHNYILFVLYLVCAVYEFFSPSDDYFLLNKLMHSYEHSYNIHSQFRNHIHLSSEHSSEHEASSFIQRATIPSTRVIYYTYSIFIDTTHAIIFCVPYCHSCALMD
jgi:hypothetical protein